MRHATFQLCLFGGLSGLAWGRGRLSLRPRTPGRGRGRCGLAGHLQPAEECPRLAAQGDRAGSECTSRPSNPVEVVVTCVCPVTLSSVACLRVRGLPGGTVQSCSGTQPASLLLAVGSCSSLRPQRVHMLKRHSDESGTRAQAPGRQRPGLGVCASQSDRAWGTGNVSVRKTPNNKIGGLGPGRGVAGSVSGPGAE